MWSHLVNLLKQKDVDLSGQTDLSVQVMTLINKVLDAVPDQDTFYDIVNVLDEQEIDKIIQTRSKIKGVNPELVKQFQIFEAMIREEDSRQDGRTTDVKSAENENASRLVFVIFNN